MSKLIRIIEELFLFVVSIGCFIVSIGDLFDLFHLVTPEHMPTLSFLLLATILGSLAFLQNKVLELHKNLEEFRGETELEQMKHAINQMDATLLKVLGVECFIDVFEFFQTAMKEHKVLFNDATRFFHHFIHTLQCYPRTTFWLAISVTACNNSALESALATFMKSGGKLKCILFVKNVEDIASTAFQSFQMRQVQLGVELLVIMYSSIPDDLKKNFIVESKGKIAWDMQMDDEGSIKSGTVITNRDVTMRYYQSFERLLRMSRPA